MASKQNKKTPVYIDGSEERPDNIFLNNQKYDIDNLEWEMYYHLTPRRQNLISWYDFKKNATLLEVGAGCGAMTGIFLEKMDQVTAVELEESRARVIRERYKKYDNLRVIVSPIEKSGDIGKFDYVTSIGVLEYAGKYNNSLEPYKEFLEKLGSLLKEDGTMILALENKYGLKYWAGSGEDHTSRPFDSLEGYPQSKDIQTFSRSELINLLESAGFQNHEFYYPFPDYKLPNEIFSDRYLPSAQHSLRPSCTPFYDVTARGLKIFNERLVMDQLASDGYMDIFANSFLVFCSKGGKQ